MCEVEGSREVVEIKVSETLTLAAVEVGPLQATSVDAGPLVSRSQETSIRGLSSEIKFNHITIHHIQINEPRKPYRVFNPGSRRPLCDLC